MKITKVKMSILEMDGTDQYYDLIKLHGQRRERWLHHAVPAREKKRYEYVLHVETDEGCHWNLHDTGRRSHRPTSSGCAATSSACSWRRPT